MQEAQKATVELIKTRENTTKMLNLVHQALNQSPLMVAPLVIGSWLFPVFARWDDGERTVGDDKSDQVIVVVAAIRQNILAQLLPQQSLGLGTFMAFTTGQDKVQGVAQSIGFDMDFGTKAARTPTERLGGLPTVFLRLQQRTDEREQWLRRA